MQVNAIKPGSVFEELGIQTRVLDAVRFDIQGQIQLVSRQALVKRREVVPGHPG